MTSFFFRALLAVCLLLGPLRTHGATDREQVRVSLTVKKSDPCKPPHPKPKHWKKPCYCMGGSERAREKRCEKDGKKERKYHGSIALADWSDDATQWTVYMDGYADRDAVPAPAPPADLRYYIETLSRDTEDFFVSEDYALPAGTTPIFVPRGEIYDGAFTLGFNLGPDEPDPDQARAVTVGLTMVNSF